jgi:hypothetical protein
MFFRFEVLIAEAMKSSIFRDIILCSTEKVNQCFIGMHHLCLQGQRVRQASPTCIVLVLFQNFLGRAWLLSQAPIPEMLLP